MNMKKILLFAVILMIAISSLGVVSSSLVRDDSVVNDGSRMITVDGGEDINSNGGSDVSDDGTYFLKGFKFHILDGYTKVSEHIGDDMGIGSQKESNVNFTNDKGSSFTISIFPTHENITIENPKTIEGIEGDFKNVAGDYVFTYYKSGNKITIVAPTEAIIGRILDTD